MPIVGFLDQVSVVADGEDQNKAQSKRKFLYPQGRYRGEFTPENLAFNSNLQEFAQRIAFICGLETGGKVTPEEAYQRIKELWQELKQSKANLLDEPKPPPPEAPPDP